MIMCRLILVGQSGWMGGPPSMAFIPRAGVVRINVLGGSHPRLGRAGSPPAHLPPPAPAAARRSRSLFFSFARQPVWGKTDPA